MSDGFGHEKPHEGQTNDWISPEKLVRMLGHFDLDPCESDTQPWPLADKGYRLGRGEDGLKLPWSGRVYANPPYGPHVIHWVKVGDGYLLPHGRTCFYLPDGKRAKSGTAPSALIAFGEANVDCLRTCGLAGAFFGRAQIIEGIKISSL